MTNYYSKTKDELVNINDMHHQHVWYAFKKLCDRLEELGICEHIWEDDYAFWNQHKFVRKDVYELMFDKATRQDNTIKHLLNENSKLKKKFDKAVSELFEGSKSKTNANSKSVFKLEKEISKLREFIALQDKKIMRMYNDQKHIGHRYVFSNIPNDLKGQEFVQMMKVYFNDKTYSMRARGQYLDKDKLSKGESWRNFTYGQPLHKSKCIRLYIEKKKGK